MQNFTELINRSLVNPLKERLAALQSANEENAKSHKALGKDLSATNERQEIINSNLNEVAKQLQAVTCRIDKMEQEFKACQETQNALIAALEGLKWNEESGNDLPAASLESAISSN